MMHILHWKSSKKNDDDIIRFLEEIERRKKERERESNDYKKLLYEEGFTIKGAINFINKEYRDKKSYSQDGINQKIILIKSLLNEGLTIIKKNLD